jgi:broad specificity phosphatase PhoE
MKYPEGESLLELYQRIKSSLEQILSLDNSLIVTHRGVINMFYYILNEVPLDMNKSQFGVTHASIHELEPKKRKIKRIYYETNIDNRKEDDAISS